MLDTLQTDVLDDLVLHSPLSHWPQTQEGWQAMEGIIERKGSRPLGISNCHDQRLLERLVQAARVKPAVAQNRFYAQTHYDRELPDFCRDHGIPDQRFWTLTANPGILSHPMVQSLAQQYRHIRPNLVPLLDPEVDHSSPRHHFIGAECDHNVADLMVIVKSATYRRWGGQSNIVNPIHMSTSKAWGRELPHTPSFFYKFLKLLKKG